MLTDLFRAGGVRTQLVFVSACHSESAGHSFAAAGVRESIGVWLLSVCGYLRMHTSVLASCDVFSCVWDGLRLDIPS